MSTKSSFEYGSIKSRLVFQESLIIFCSPKIHRSGDKDSSIHNKQQTSFRSETRSYQITGWLKLKTSFLLQENLTLRFCSKINPCEKV